MANAPAIASPFPWTGPVLDLPSAYPQPENTLDIPQVWYPQPSMPTVGLQPGFVGYQAPSGGWSLLGFASETIPLLEALFPFLYAFFSSFGAATPKPAPSGGRPIQATPPAPPPPPPPPPPGPVPPPKPVPFPGPVYEPPTVKPPSPIRIASVYGL